MGPQAEHRRSWTMRRTLLVLAATGALILASAGSAWARFTTSGSGSGQATTGTVSMSLSLTAGSNLFPGSSVSVTVKVTNTSATRSLTLQSLTGGTTTISTAGQGTCDPSVVTFAAGTLPGAITAGSFANVSGTVSMSAGALTGCQGATFSIPLTAIAQAS